MLRPFYLLIGLVTVVISFLLQNPLLIPAAGSFFVLALGMAFGKLFRRSRKEDAPVAAGPHEEDLSSFGILEIRPKGQPPSPRAADSESGAEEMGDDGVGSARPRDSRSGEASSASTHGVSTPTVRVKSVADAHATDERLKKEMLVPYLSAVQAAISATTVCLLRADEGAPLRYNIEAIVSRNGYARSHGHFTSKSRLVSAAKNRKPVSLHRVGEKGIAAKSLGYYAEAIAVKQVAVAPVPVDGAGAEYLLLADTLEEGGLGAKKQRDLLAQFAGVLTTLLDTRAEADEEAETEPEVVADEPRPRREIIADEMRSARADEREMALALVYLNPTDTFDEGGPEVVEQAEGRLEEYLRNQADGTDAYRIERFGELTFGVFFRGGVAEVEGWAVDLQHGLDDAEGLLSGGISVGIAVMQPHHESPDTLRADATEALREAYETGACTIIG